MNDDPRTDESLMLAFRDGDAAAFEVLYGRWRGPVYRYFLRQCNHGGQADELFQDVFMRVIDAAGGYQPTARFPAWLFRIARNRLVDHWRKTGREPLDPLDPPPGDGEEDRPVDPPGPEAERPDREAEQGELRAALLAALAELPEPQREAFLLAEEGGLTLEEIATVAGVGRETIKSRLRYAVGKLRNALESWR